MKEVFVVSAARTALGSFNGCLSTVPTTKLGAAAIKSVLDRVKLDPALVRAAYMGCVYQGNLGQAPARQAAKFGGLPNETQCTTINKVCASGMKSIIIAAQDIMLGDAEVVVAGGMENMSAVPYYLDAARTGYRLGNGTLIDGLVKDGLTDVYLQNHMGNSAELCARELKISREEQDAFAIESYTRAAKAWKEGRYAEEIAPVTVSSKKGDVVVIEDEEYKQVNFEKIPQLKPVFDKAGTVTAANASTLNDGAAAMILMSRDAMTKAGLKPMARIVSYADVEQAPEWFTTTPSKAIPAAVHKGGLKMGDISFFEINEAFSVVSIANNRLMNLDPSKVNIYGGAVALGHPLGVSGARICVTLLNVLKQNGARYGAAGICNGGGGGSAMVFERL